MAEEMNFPKNISCRADGSIWADGAPVDGTAMEFCLKMMDCYHLTPQRMKDSINFEQTIEKLTKEKKEFETKNEKCEKDYSRLLLRNGDLQGKNDILLKKNISLEKLKNSLEKENEKYKKYIAFYKKNKDLTVLKAMNDSLSKDTDSLHRTIRDLKKNDTTLNNTINLKTKELENVKKEYNDYKNDHQLAEIIKEPWIFAPSIALIITLIISITMISLKRGLTFTKGNTSICLGEKKKTRTKKVD